MFRMWPIARLRGHTVQGLLLRLLRRTHRPVVRTPRAKSKRDGGEMDVLVLLEDRPEHSTVLAHVNSVPSPLNSERPSRDVVTLFGDATPESLALALAAAVEAQREPGERLATIRHVALWPERGAVGDAAWRDDATGHLVTNDLAIPFATLQKTAERLLGRIRGSHSPTGGRPADARLARRDPPRHQLLVGSAGCSSRWRWRTHRCAPR